MLQRLMSDYIWWKIYCVFSWFILVKLSSDYFYCVFSSSFQVALVISLNKRFGSQALGDDSSCIWCLWVCNQIHFFVEIRMNQTHWKLKYFIHANLSFTRWTRVLRFLTDLGQAKTTVNQYATLRSMHPAISVSEIYAPYQWTNSCLNKRIQSIKETWMEICHIQFHHIVGFKCLCVFLCVRVYVACVVRA